MFRMAFVPPFRLEFLPDRMILYAIKRSNRTPSCVNCMGFRKSINFYLLALFCLWFLGLRGQPTYKTDADIDVGAERLDLYLESLSDKKVGVVANQTSTVYGAHLVDTLIALEIDVKKVFSPEHGFRGKADAGSHISNSRDPKTGLKIVSLYGGNKKPKYTDLENLDVILFDLQDVGVRFYTYISTLHYVMEACAQYEVELIVLDRPNPNGFYVDGPVLEEGFSSFVGMHPVPLVHGMTIGEYAAMINGEKWLDGGIQCELTIVPCKGYDHKIFYEIPIKPSPNLPNMSSIYLYPSLGLFEGTIVSVGRGTTKPFQQFGHPDIGNTGYTFTPESMPGATTPKLEGKKCNAFDLEKFGQQEMPKLGKVYLNWLKAAYDEIDSDKFFLKNNFIDLLSGTDRIQKMIFNGASVKEMEESWKDDVDTFKSSVRSKYLLYPDFE